VHFACDNGSSLDVVFEGSQATVTPAGGEPLVLPQAMAADGFLYATPQHSLRGKGDEVTWTVGKMVPTTCKVR
jgi:membrane-bound inhibitor of C-type lysozyme